MRFWIPFALLGVLFFSTRCGLMRSVPDSSTSSDRLSVFPVKKLPLKAPVEILWNENQIPFIEAQTDEDAAFALGMVHAHLRLGQMEMLRMVSAGRISEMAGPFTVDYDRTLRILGIGNAVPEIEKNLPPETRAWLTHFTEGINFYRRQSGSPPYEVSVLGLGSEPWTLTDILRLTRLAAADVNWIVFLTYFNLRQEAGFDAFWSRYLRHRSISSAGIDLPGQAEGFAHALSLTSHFGSNAVVVDGSRSRRGAPLLAGDPHLGISIPNFWLLAGVRCPSYQMVGMMIPGLPFLALGRNERVAWGGTNMHSQSTELFDVSHLSDDAPEIETRRETIGVRFLWNRSVQVRTSPWGPLISDSPLFKKKDEGEKIAIRWVGHSVSDELSAFLKANRAQNAQEFADAFRSYAVSGQNLLFADQDGHIGKIAAARLPKREAPLAVITPTGPGAEARQSWKEFWTSAELPHTTDPKQGYLVSANDRLPPGSPYIGTFFPEPDRAQRLEEKISAAKDWDVAKLSALQRDVFSRSSVAMRDRFLARLHTLGETQLSASSPWLIALKNWDGEYHEKSQGAVAFQLLLYHFIRASYASQYSPALLKFLLGSEICRRFAWEDLEDPSRALPALQTAAAKLSEDFPQQTDWGSLHRLRIAHPLSMVPVLKGGFEVLDLPGRGSSETLQKTAHEVTNQRHYARYGSQARQISDLADIDENYFVLLGGQDGWLGSENLLDQVPLWREGKLIRIPLRKQTVAKHFIRKLHLTPASPSESG